MSTTMPLSEFNRNPSQATRLARIGAVTITDRGLPAFELRALAPPLARAEALVRAGVLTPPRVRSTTPLPDFGIDPSLAQAIIAQIDQETSTRDY